MYPHVFDILEYNNQYFYLTDAGYIGTAFRCDHIDHEVQDLDLMESLLSRYLKELDPSLVVTIRSTSDFLDEYICDNVRAEHINSLSISDHSLFIFLETRIKLRDNLFSLFSEKQKKFDEYIHNLLNLINLQSLKSIFRNIQGLSGDDLEPFFYNSTSNITTASYGLNNGSDCIGILKLTELSGNNVSLEALCQIREIMPLPIELIFKQMRLSNVRAQSYLKRRVRQEQSSSDLTSQRRTAENQTVLSELELSGHSLHQFELHIVLKRRSEERLRFDLGLISSYLAPLGRFNIETTGAWCSYASTFPGSHFHIPMVELNEALPCYIPCFLNSDTSLSLATQGSLLFQRSSNSLTQFYPFDSRYTSYSIAVIGNTGFGKSLWANTFLRSVLNEKESQAILVDVKSSHLRTCEKLGGVVKQIHVEAPTGINPFSILSRNRSKDTIEVILGFISQLMLAEGEIELPISTQVEVEKALINYIASGPKKPSLDEFLKNTKTFSRREYLERFRSDGLLGNLFSDSNVNKEDNHLVYYDFKNLQSASNKAVSTGVMAAVMADFYLRVLEKSKNQKMYFICDETPFFVRHCFPMFRLLIKNVRKLNISLVLIAQKHDDLIVNNDTSLIENAAIKVIFTYDGQPDIFAQRLKLNSDHIELLNHFAAKKDPFSKFIIRDEIGTRVGKLMLSATEYLLSTTSGDEVDRIENIQKLIPNLSQDEVISILAAERIKKDLYK